MTQKRRQALREAKALTRRNGTSYLFRLEDGLPDLPVFHQVLGLYDTQCGERLMPAWRDFSFRDLHGWHSDFALYEFEAGDSDMTHGVCKMMGENYQACFRDAIRHGMPLADVEDTVRPTLLAYLERILRGPEIGFFTGNMSYAGREHVAVDILDLPATDREGRVRYVMSFVSRHVA